MQKQRQPKGLTPADYLKGLAFIFSTWSLMPTHAETVYRCGEAYSTSNQCANAVATEVKPSSILHTTGQDKNNAAASDLRDAQTLEKQRRQAEHQAAQTAPVRVSTPQTLPPIATNNEPLAPNGKHKGKHARKPTSPYFTAVNPNAAPKKKSTAKAVPAGATSSQ
jgi:hypothetical protein